MIDATAHGVAPHQPGIEWLQEFGDRCDVLHSGVEPQIIAVSIKDDGHPVVDG
jgi:hypothetical protein